MASDQFTHLLEVVGQEADSIELIAAARSVQHPDDRFLPGSQRNRRESQIRCAPVHFYSNRPVLRQTALRDIHLAEDLQAGHQRRMETSRNLQLILQESIQPE